MRDNIQNIYELKVTYVFASKKPKSIGLYTHCS